MSAFIPQLDPSPETRAANLAGARSVFQFNYAYVSPLALVDRVPAHHEFSNAWLKTVGANVLTTLSNRFTIEGDSRFGDFLRAKHELLAKVLGAGVELFLGVLRETVAEALSFAGRSTATPRRPTDLEDFAGLFRTIGLPPIAQTASDDQVFVYQRLAGPNPVVLQRIAGLDSRFPVAEQLFQSIVPGDSLTAAGSEGRLFLADYQMLDGAEAGTFPHGSPKYLFAPLALFVVDRHTRQMRPVAIQCHQVPAQDNPIFTPNDGWNWRIAKVTVEIADGNMHEAVTHLGRTHLLMEPFVVCTNRQLAANHPIWLLLAPHFEGTLAINDAAWRHLIANKGAVDKLLGGTIKTSQTLTIYGVQTCRFNEAMLPRALSARGVADTEWLANYPYRDDAMLYWDAIRQWAADYLALYYPQGQNLADDQELQAWLAELASPSGGRVAGLAAEGPVTPAYLTDMITMILYTCSVQHAAVNFPQYDIMSYVPAMPLAGYSGAEQKQRRHRPGLLEHVAAHGHGRAADGTRLLARLGPLHHARRVSTRPFRRSARR